MSQTRSSTIFATSWDDGHPLDLRIADQLTRHGLAGTFYVPRFTGRPVMSESEIRSLAERFDVGAHALHHFDLTRLEDRLARQEITGSKAWIEDVTGRPCSTFCFPGGRFRSRHLRIVEEAGFRGARTVELLSTRPPRTQGGVALIATTLQAYPHRRRAYLRNLIRRQALRNLRSFVVAARQPGWVRTAAELIDRTVHLGGVFHLWGHSWEIEATQQWNALDEVLARMAGAHPKARTLTCAQLADHAHTH